MKTMKASEFKAKCLKVMDEVADTGEGVVITKNGVPVSVVGPYRPKVETLWGVHADMLEMKDDLIEPTGEEWAADG